MTHYLSHVSQSSLGQYVDSLASHLSASKFALPTPAWIPDYVRAADAKTTSFFLLPIGTLVLILAMSSWRDFFRRPAPPPAYSNVANPPFVSDRDYDYITPGADSYDTAPDTVLLRHRRNTYELQFPPYAINEGRLRVGQLRLRAAEATGTPDPKRIKLLYKGTLLDDDARPCCDEGLKQHSEVLCVVSGVTPSDPGSDDAASDPALTHTTTTTTTSTTPSDGADPDAQPSQPRKRVRNRGKKGKKSKNRRAIDENNDDDESPATPGPAAGSGGGASGMPALPPNMNLFTTALAKVHALSGYLHRVLLPLCEAYIAAPPVEPKAREFEYKKLSETILAQVILRADGIDPESDEERMARRALIKEAQTTLNRLDVARGDHS